MEPGLCERVGCGEPQVCALLIAPQETQAWLISPSHEAAFEGVALCEAHADRITVPFGWTLVDDRVQPKRKKRRKKAAAVDAAPPQPLPEVSEVPTETDPASGAAAASGATATESYVEPEYQFREDGAAPEDAPTETEPEPAIVDEADSEAPDAEPRLKAIPSGDELDGGSEGGDDTGELQGALFNSADDEQAEPDETTPLLQRAFRVVRDD